MMRCLGDTVCMHHTVGVWVCVSPSLSSFWVFRFVYFFCSFFCSVLFFSFLSSWILCEKDVETPERIWHPPTHFFLRKCACEILSWKYPSTPSPIVEKNWPFVGETRAFFFEKKKKWVSRRDTHLMILFVVVVSFVYCLFEFTWVASENTWCVLNFMLMEKAQ